MVSEARELMRGGDETEAPQPAGAPLPKGEAHRAAAAAAWVDAAQRFQARLMRPDAQARCPCSPPKNTQTPLSISLI